MSDNERTNSSNGSANENTEAAPKRFGDGPDEADSGNTETLEALKAEAEKFKNEYLYLRAEFENFKKHSIKDRSDLRKYGAERLAIDLLSVLDIFETALASEVNAENINNFRKGIEMTAAELKSALQRNGIEEIPAKGKPFDPAVHEALSSQETTEVPPGTVSQVFKKPYKLHDRVIRPGQVIVAKSKGDS